MIDVSKWHASTKTIGGEWVGHLKPPDCDLINTSGNILNQEFMGLIISVILRGTCLEQPCSLFPKVYLTYSEYSSLPAGPLQKYCRLPNTFLVFLYRFKVLFRLKVLYMWWLFSYVNLEDFMVYACCCLLTAHINPPLPIFLITWAVWM